MKLDIDDQRLTAYALGELEVAEREEIEKALAEPENAQAAKAVEEIRSTAGVLARAYRQQSAESPGLDRARQAALEQAGQTEDEESRPSGGFSWRRLAFALGGTFVVLLLVGVGLVSFYGDNIRAMYSSTSNSLAGNEQYPGMVTRQDQVYRHRSLKSFGPQAGAQGYDGAIVASREAREQFADGDPHQPGFNTESYDHIVENKFKEVAQNPLSTFSIDVDTASYSNVRRFLSQGSMPPKDAVRIEEMINYFDYDYPQPEDEHPFSVNVDVAEAPWKTEHRLVRIGLKGREMDWDSRPASNLVFLIDVSGSMNSPNKLPLLKQSMRLLLGKLDERDRVAMVVYAGSSGLVLPPTTCDDKMTILRALSRLQSGGSTHGSAGIKQAYAVARQNFVAEGNNRVILATDGDFNVGQTSHGDLIRLIEKEAESGVFLTVLGFGMGNYKDSNLEMLADKGNGNYAYIDTVQEAKKVLGHQIAATLVTIAKDVKIQVEFNPSQVNAYRLVGYENRILAKEDFNDDTVDAGEIGAGHTVTALYEVVPVGVEIDTPKVDALKYQRPSETGAAAGSGELLTVKLRYKQPQGSKSRLIERPVVDRGETLRSASPDFRFAAAVAAFGMLLRDSEYKGSATFGMVGDLAASGRSDDRYGFRAEFEQLVELAEGR